MEFAIIGLFISLYSIFLRSILLPRGFQLSHGIFRLFILLSLIANVSAFVGFHLLASGTATTNGNKEYSLVIAILTILSAGAIAGFWGVEYKDAKPDETHFLNVVSALFVIIFYALFFSVCFYIGKIQKPDDTVSWVIPGLMAFLLEINAVVDIWDYRN
jgi:hypothetical protein